MMKKVLKFLSLFVLVVAEFAANTPSQLGSYQMDAPNNLKSDYSLFLFLNNFTNINQICIIFNK